MNMQSKKRSSATLEIFALKSGPVQVGFSNWRFVAAVMSTCQKEKSFDDTLLLFAFITAV